ncbi:MAG: glycosyltransferase family 9 protein [Bdellovibrionota bacterium]
MKKNKNICVVAITRLGDMLQASPTFAGLKRENPDSKITVVIDKQFAQICAGIPGIDEVFVLDLSMVVRCIHRGGDGIVEAYRYVDRMVKDLQEREFDFVLNMSSSAYTALLLKMMGAAENRGWLADDEGFRLITDPWAMLFAAFVYHSNREYNGLNLVDIFRCAAGVKDHPLHLVYHPTEEERTKGAEIVAAQQLTGKGPLIGIQAGASQEKRQWPPSHFAELSRILIEKLDARILFVGSPSEEWIFADVQKRVPHSNLGSAMGKTTFGELGAVLEKLDVLITGDTGPMHMAVAVGKPVVALFLASALGFETGPYSAGNFILQPQIACNPCNPNFPCARPDCHGQITPELVAYLAEVRIRTPRGFERDIELKEEYRSQQDVAIYCTEFDGDGFLRCRLLGGASARHGEKTAYYDFARAAYRALWKEEFDSIPYRELPPDEDKLELSHPNLEGIKNAIALTEQGIGLLGELSALVLDHSGSPHRLAEVSKQIQEVDTRIEEIGLSYPLIGALIRIFLMEKENLRGDDVLVLASKTKELYSRLERRGRRFANLFSHFERVGT